MTDLTVLGEFVYTAVGIISWVGMAAVACSMVLVILFASMPAFDWLFTTSQQREASTEDASAGTEEKLPSNVYSDIYSTPLGTYVLPC